MSDTPDVVAAWKQQQAAAIARCCNAFPTDTPELNVWRNANSAFSLGNPGRREQAAAAVIRDYGDKRYQQAIADVVEWLHSENGLCDCFARSATECACGAWDDYKEWPLERTAQEITNRFGKDA